MYKFINFPTLIICCNQNKYVFYVFHLSHLTIWCSSRIFQVVCTKRPQIIINWLVSGTKD